MTHSILIIGPSWVGDMVMAQSLFKLLKSQDPACQIDVLAPAWTFSLLSRMPEVRTPIEMPIKHGELKLRERYRLAKSFRNRYTQAIVIPHSFKAALIPWLAGIPIRTGWVGEARYFLLNDARRLNKSAYPLMIQQLLALGLPAHATLPTLSDYYPRFEIAAHAMDAAARTRGLQFTDAPILAICPGAEFGPSKRWPEAYYAQVANQKMAEGWVVWLFGSAKDKPVTEKIMALTQNRCVDLAGLSPLPETIDLFAGIAGVLSNDSGLLHVAAAVGKPVIAVYGSTSPSFTPPLSNEATVLKLNLPCQPCFQRTCPLKHHRCMIDLTPDQVLAAMSQWRV